MVNLELVVCEGRDTVRDKCALLHQAFSKPHPVAGADGEQRVVEIVARVMQHAAVVGRAVAGEDVAAGAGLQHERKIFRAHAGLDAGGHVRRAGDFGRGDAGPIGFLSRVDRGGIPAFVVDLGGASQ